jgi:hypothetical protein
MPRRAPPGFTITGATNSASMRVERIVIRGRITQSGRKAWLKPVVVRSVDGQKLEGQK